MELTIQQKQIHERAILLAKQHRKVESQLIQVLQEVDQLKFFKRLGQPSLFMYATEILDLSESVAYMLISVARKAKEIPELNEAISSRQLSASKASRLVSSLNPNNADELIEFAKSHRLREIEFKLAEGSPVKKSFSRMTPISKDQVEVKVVISKETYEKLKRIESLEAQRGRGTKLPDVLDAVMEVYLQYRDPVRKAERSEALKNRVSLKLTVAPVKAPTNIKSEVNMRKPLTAEQKHAVFLRDQGKCAHMNASNKRCNEDRWTDIHHIVRVADGGSNELENLTTLCSFHHDLVHQLSLPIEGQVSWLRSSNRGYAISRPREYDHAFRNL